MTVAALRSSMTIEEEAGWVEYHTLLGEEQKKRMAEMKAKPQYKRGRR